MISAFPTMLSEIFPVILRLVTAALIGGAIGLEREAHGRTSGLRTHILVCLGSAMTSLTSVYVLSNVGFDGDVFRIPAQVISGIGFLGAGTILVRKTSVVTGLTTAAGMWVTAAAGIAVGYGFYLGAILCCILMLVTLHIFRRLEKKIKRPQRIYIELRDMELVNETISQLKTIVGEHASIYVVTAKSQQSPHIGITARIGKNLEYTEVLKRVNALDSVVFAVED